VIYILNISDRLPTSLKHGSYNALENAALLPLLRLPAEMRNRIYDYVLGGRLYVLH
jgi:hypothetical protein